ncbi:MAG: hypothetical protein GF418_01020 [Chitinivibrionales bacterium]|nr:hypothetical protein [Chitinivibrionales bacterium]MBD3394183.1 hypothetical protein [Chitinivibrionales bacterium]
MTPSRDTQYPFRDFQPVYWNPCPRVSGETGPEICSVKRNHGIKSSYRLHNPRDELNEGRQFLDRAIVEYRIGYNSYSLYTIGDFFEAGYALDPKADGNIRGDVAERIARRITKYWLRHFSRSGYPGGVFDKRFNPTERNDYIVAHAGRYILKIQKYPNLVILDNTGKGKYGYESIKELDGLFDYRCGKQRHVLVLESKLERINVDCDDLIHNLFTPLRQLLPAATFTYVLFSDRESIYVKKGFERLRQLKHLPHKIYTTLKSQGIGVLFFTFNETAADFERIKNHLITQYRATTHLGIELHGRMRLSDKEITLFDGGETPHLKLVKDKHSGLWREVKLTHKRKKVK